VVRGDGGGCDFAGALSKKGGGLRFVSGLEAEHCGAFVFTVFFNKKAFVFFTAIK
jgi:hypothetical protein